MKRAIQGARILLVDDKPSNLAVLFETLDHFDCTVLVAQSGERGLELARSEQPDIILLDILMPGIDGYEVCRALKEDSRTQGIPVIFVSALSGELDMVKAFELGAVDYISKPIRREEVLARVGAHLTIKRQQERLLRFFSIIAHDLRSPFHSLIGGAQLLIEDAGLDDAARAEITESLFSNANKAYQLTQNLLEWGRVQQQSIDDKLEPQPLRAIADAAIGIVQPRADAKEQSLVLDLEPDLAVLADRQMMESVLRNLLSNAVKFTPHKGRITLDACLQGDTVEIRVSDTGTGIPEDEIDSLFRMDRKFQHDGTDAEKGSGLGLLVTKEMLDLQNATITVTSTWGEGTSFTIRMRAAG